MDKLSIILTTYQINDQVSYLTECCIKSLRKYTDVPYELIIVDNGSERDLDYLMKEADIFVRSKINRGNAWQWNAGLKLSSGNHLLLCDNDVEFLKGWAKPLIKLLKNPKVGIAFPLTKNKEELDFSAKLAGFCWMMRRDTWIKMGPICEDYFLNFEDTDYFMRTKQRGYLLKVAPESKVIHYSRATCDYVPEATSLYKKNEQKFLEKFGEFPTLD